MNKFKKILLTTVFAVTALSVTSLTACDNGKDTKKFALSFETNGAASIAQENKEEGSKYTLPTPSRDGYEFEGWYTDPSFSGSPVTEITVSADVKFYAKWTKLLTLTLNADGGTVDTTSLTIKEGASIYDAVKNIVPAKTGLTFGAWFIGDNEVNSSTLMTADTTLTARYKVAYTVEIYVQKADKSGYELEETKSGSGYVGSAYVASVTKEGYEEVANPDAKTEGNLSGNASENVFRHYFDRLSINLTFKISYPDGTTAEDFVINDVAAGTETEVPSDYQADGYVLVGWTTKEGGSVEVYANYIYDRLYNKTEADVKNTLNPTASATYYAVWEEAYTDMFGGADKVYFFDGQKSVYIERNGVFYRAEYSAKDNTFTLIHTTEDTTLLKGKLNDDLTYVYADKTRDGYTAYLYAVGSGLDKTKVIVLDQYNGITYNEYDEKNKITVSATGYYTVEDGNQCVAVFESGDLEGQIMTFVRGTITVNEQKRNAFQVRNEDDINMGTISRVMLNGEGKLVTLREQYYGIKLNGFGVATMSTVDLTTGKEGTANYYYSFNEDRTLLTLRVNGMQTAGVLSVFTHNGMKVYNLYDSQYDRTITSGNTTLKTDGVHTAEYNDGKNTVTGNYVTGTSVFGYMVTLYGNDSKTYKFLVTSASQEVEGEDGNKKVETIYSFEKKDASYAEYYYSTAEGIYYAPLLVIDNLSEGKASFYGYTANKTYELISTGTVTKGSADGAYRYTAKEYFIDKFTSIEEVKDKDGNVTAYSYYITDENGEKKLWMQPTVNIAMVEYADIIVDSVSTKYSVNFWSSYKLKDGEVETLTKIYDGENGAKLTVWGGFAKYTEGNNSYYGTLVMEKAGYYVLTYNVTVESKTTTQYMYFELNTDALSLTKLAFAPYTAAEMLSDGTASKTITLALDGKGAATYTTVEGEGDAAEKVTLAGTADTTGAKTVFGDDIYRFRSGNTSFEFVRVVVSNSIYFARLNSSVNGVYTFGDSRISLDGFGYRALYTDESGNEIKGYYYLGDNGALTFISESGYIYLDLKDDKTFTKRGFEYGTYVVLNNRTNGGMTVAFDGYGKLTLSVTSLNEETGKYETKEIATDVEYKLADGYCTFTYTMANGTAVTLKGQFGYFKSGTSTYKAFFVKNEEVVMNFVDTNDWSVLSLDGYGNAVKVGKTGQKETGTYMLITDNLLYYATDSDASIYTYNLQNGTVSPVENRARGYYTKDLESLVFTKYGFAVFNGATRYYYNVVDGVCYIYHQEFDENGLIPQETNKYGYIEEVFGEFSEVKEYDGKTYYHDDGAALHFERPEENAGKFRIPVQGEKETEYRTIGHLTFTPSGADQFAVSGKVMLGDTQWDCSVYRIMNDEKVETFILIKINSLSYFRLDINVDYQGSGVNSYDIVSMKRIMGVRSYNYWYMYYMYSMIYGQQVAQQLPNVFGTLQLVYEYDLEGKETIHYMTGEFGKASGAYDVNGNIIVFDKADFERQGETGQNYIATFTVKNADDEQNPDTYTYKMYFSIQSIQALRTSGFVTIALTRTQTLTTTNGYTVELERNITSDSGYPAGYLFAAKLYNGEKTEENAIEYTVRFQKNNVWYLVSRTTDESGKITANKYYKLTVVEADIGGEQPGEPSEGEETKIIAPYESVSISIEDGKAIYAANGEDYVDVDSEGNALLLTVGGSTYLVTEVEADPDNANVKIVTVGGSKKYKLETKTGDSGEYIEITEITESAEENK